MVVRNKDRNAVSWHVRAAGREDFTGCGVPTSTVVGRVVHDLSGYPHDEQCGNCRRARRTPPVKNVHELVQLGDSRTLCGVSLLPSTLTSTGDAVTCGNCKRMRERSARRRSELA